VGNPHEGVRRIGSVRHRCPRTSSRLRRSVSAVVGRGQVLQDSTCQNQVEPPIREMLEPWRQVDMYPPGIAMRGSAVGFGCTQPPSRRVGEIPVPLVRRIVTSGRCGYDLRGPEKRASRYRLAAMFTTPRSVSIHERNASVDVRLMASRSLDDCVHITEFSESW
jgi:hypothetical protein